MLADNEIIEVSNKISGTVVYGVPDRNNLVRMFNPGEKKKVEMGELRQLSYDVGGLAVLRNYLTIHNKEACEELIGQVEPEYYYTINDIKKLLETGTIDQFEDFLNFAPEGTREQMKDLAVSTRLNDNRKREMIKAKLGFDVTNAIKLLEDDTEKVVPTQTATRKATPINEVEKESTTPSRKAAPVTDKVFSNKKYDVVD